MINVAVLGYGTVGSGVVEVIEKNKDMVNKKSAQELEVKYILDLRDFPGDPYEDKVIHDFNTILHDDSVTIVCETMGGVGAAYQFTKQALERGKSVCTSNKELVAKHGPELLQIAREHNCNYLFEASVGGGIPIIRPLNYSLTAEKIEAINGILNGTTNYILSKMEKEGADFAAVLKEAQDKGYAERNPEADVEGYDACRKIAILSSLMFSKNVDSEKVPTEGITKITAADFEYANATDHTIKLLGRSRAIDDNTAEVMVAPFLLSKEHPLAMVHGVFNAVFVTGNMPEEEYQKLLIDQAIMECMTNCARHAGGTRVFVKITNNKVLCKVQITNNGKIPAEGSQEGGGLTSLRKTVEREGGKMQVIFSPEFELILLLSHEKDREIKSSEEVTVKIRNS